jgi:multiple sugar transport system ATP-binding protein
MASVQLDSVRKSFGNAEVIHGVSVDIADGEFVVLVGPSGCGKSTVLRMVAGLEAISGGEIRIDDRVVNDLEPKDRDIAMVFQNYALYPQMTVAQNLGFALEMAKVKRAAIAQKVKAVASTLGLEPLLDRYPRQLSGGQRQRVAMGRAIVRDPKVFLFDEPLSNLDAKLRVHMRAEVKDLQQRLATTTIYVTHDQVEAMTMADKIVVLNAGRVEQVGPPLELYDRPANMFVAGFLGSPAMNFLPGTIRSAGGHPHLELPGGERLPLTSVPAGMVDRPVICGIRPENLLVGAAEGLQAAVTLVEPTGSETHVVGKVGELELTCVARERVALKLGQKVKLAITGSAGHFFDPDSQQRLD